MIRLILRTISFGVWSGSRDLRVPVLGYWLVLLMLLGLILLRHERWNVLVPVRSGKTRMFILGCEGAQCTNRWKRELSRYTSVGTGTLDGLSRGWDCKRDMSVPLGMWVSVPVPQMALPGVGTVDKGSSGTHGRYRGTKGEGKYELGRDKTRLQAIRSKQNEMRLLSETNCHPLNV